MPHILVKKSFYDSGWSSVDNPYGPGGYAYDGPPIPEPEPKPKGPSEQLTLPYFDPQLDYRTGWEGVEPVTAIRYMGDYEAGTPVEQDDMNVHFEHGGAGGLMPRRSPNADFKAPTVDAPHGAPAPAGWKNTDTQMMGAGYIVTRTTASTIGIRTGQSTSWTWIWELWGLGGQGQPWRTCITRQGKSNHQPNW